jgi:hypothetical protein
MKSLFGYTMGGYKVQIKDFKTVVAEEKRIRRADRKNRGRYVRNPPRYD